MLRNSFKALTMAGTSLLLLACAGVDQRGSAAVEDKAAVAAEVVVREIRPVSAPVGVTIKEDMAAGRLPHRTFDRQREEEYEEEEERIRHRHD